MRRKIVSGLLVAAVIGWFSVRAIAAGDHHDAHPGTGAHEVATEGGHTIDETDTEHWSVVKEFFPKSLMNQMREAFGPSWIEGEEHIHVSHVVLAVVVFLIGLGLAMAARRKLSSPDDYLLPDKRFSAFTFFDILIEAIYNQMTAMMPKKVALEALPVVTGFAVFILLSNCMGLVPGFLPPTDTLNTTLALGGLSFLIYNYYGIKHQGLWNHLKHFAGPIPLLAPLMLPIEIIGHLARPASLALRLMGNMFGDHQVLAIFLGFELILVPLPMMVLGLVVCIVQTLVFTLLTMVYIAMAVEEHEHHDEEHGPDVDVPILAH